MFILKNTDKFLKYDNKKNESKYTLKDLKRYVIT